MSYIRPGTDPKWVDDADTEGLYVYGDGAGIRYMPTTYEEFIEVVLRMLEQSGQLSDDELEAVFGAFTHRFWGDTSEIDTTRNITFSDAYFDMATVVAYFDQHDEFEDEYEIARDLWEKLDELECDDNDE